VAQDTSLDRFEQIARVAAPRLLGYVGRRVDPPADAADVLAEVLIVALRRLSPMPADDDEAVSWLFGVARLVLANQRRGEARRHALAARLRAELATVTPEEPSAESLAVRAALARLPSADRELLSLVAWEGLTPAAAAEVLGIRATVARKRLQRARTRLAEELRRQGIEPERHPSPPWAGSVQAQDSVAGCS
jgi:RNA polymerase sigma factor (sigma-70 family)